MRKARAWAGKAMPLARASPSGGVGNLEKGGMERDGCAPSGGQTEKDRDCFVLRDCKPRRWGVQILVTARYF